MTQLRFGPERAPYASNQNSHSSRLVLPRRNQLRWRSSALLTAAEQPTPAAGQFCSTPTPTPPASPQASSSQSIASLAQAVSTAGPGRPRWPRVRPRRTPRTRPVGPRRRVRQRRCRLQVALSSALAHIAHITIGAPQLAAQQARVDEAEHSITLLNADTSPPYVARSSDHSCHQFTANCIACIPLGRHHYHCCSQLAMQTQLDCARSRQPRRATRPRRSTRCLADSFTSAVSLPGASSPPTEPEAPSAARAPSVGTEHR